MKDAARELLVLGLLRRAPLSAYDVVRAVRGHGHLYRGLRGGNIYHYLERLDAAGFVRASAVPAARGPSATKRVYRLTAAGDRRLGGVLEQVLLDPQADPTALEIAYVLLGQFPRARALAWLRERRELVAEHERRLARQFGDPKERRGSAFLGFSHALHRARAEGRFLRDAIALLESRRFHPEWIADDGPISDPARRLSG